MKIQSSNVDLYADYKSVQQSSVYESLKYWTGEQSTEASSQSGTVAGSPENTQGSALGKAMEKVLGKAEDILELSDEALAKMLKETDQASEASQSEETAYELTPKQKELIALLERFIGKLTGKKVKLDVPDKLTLSNGSSTGNQGTDQLPEAAENGVQRVGWGLNYHYEETYSEKESMVFSAQGKIVTDDGQEINFRLDISANREYSSYQSLDIKAGDALIDPLVLNYETTTTNLTDSKIAFDLDSDGMKENIASLAQGSGFLALDKDGDGKIDNGGELFGPTKGDGFQELAAYDDDLNGWIDENDSVFSELSLWIMDENGSDQLLALAQVGVGAIYLGNVDTLFSLKDANNTLNGQIQETGIFLKEDGEAGTVQHIDLAV